VSVTTLHLETVPSPIGDALLVLAEDGALVALDWADCRARLDGWLSARFDGHEIAPREAASEAADAVRRFFAGETTALDAVPVDAGGTDFQAAVWAHLRTIPPGTTTTYGAIADALGSPGAVRAVGAANGRNPISLVLPCHRVIGSDGALRGYAGGVARKRWLLQHEGAHVPAEQTSLFG